MSRERCENCASAATAEYLASNGGLHYFCSAHAPAVRPGAKLNEYEILRWRLRPDSEVSKRFKAPSESSDHESLRTELCDMQLCGAEGACRYYLSRLNGVDYFAAWSDEFTHALSDFAARHFGPSATRICQESGAPMILVGFLRRAYLAAFEHGADSRMPKEGRAIELLLRHPDWSDERIAEEVSTTMKQLRRWGDFTHARVLMQRSKAM